MKLSRIQRIALCRLAANPDWQSAYDLRLPMGTLAALERRGLVLRHDEVGSLFFPRTCIKWHLTKRGEEEAKA